MELAAALTPEDGLVLGEIGSVLILLGVASFLASKFKFSSVPIFLGAGLFFGNGGIVELNLSDDFLNLGAQIGATRFGVGLPSFDKRHSNMHSAVTW